MPFKTHLTDYLKMHAEQKGDSDAIVFEGRTVSWADLWKNVEKTSAYFSGRLGTNEQKVVDLLLTNSIDFVIAYLGALHAGHIVLPLDPAYKKLELDAFIEQVPPSLIVTQARYQDQIGHHDLPVIMVDELLKGREAGSDTLRLPAEKQVASLFFTSGTSGRPKAVPNTHANHIWNIETCSKVWDWTADDRLLISLPLSHMHGLVIGLSGALYHGNTLYLQQQGFDAQETLEMLASGKISFFTHSPFAYMKMLSVGGDYDLSGVRVCISGGAPLPPAVWEKFKERFGVEIVETYGSSETGRIAGNRLGERLAGSPGQVMPGVDLKLSKEGEVLVRSGGVFPGYWHNPQATKAATTTDGYWRTGDIAELKNGYVLLKGRVQEKIRRFSYSVSPRDVEWAMLQNHQIKDIAVIGRQNGTPNDELVYFIVTGLSDEQLNDYCKQKLMFAWRPDRIVRVPEIPRTRSGKIRIAHLRELVEA